MAKFNLISALLLVTLVTKPSKWILRGALFALGWVVLQIGILFSNLAPFAQPIFNELVAGDAPVLGVLAMLAYLFFLFKISKKYKEYIGHVHIMLKDRFGVVA